MAYRNDEDRRSYHRNYEYRENRVAYVEKYRAENREVRRIKSTVSETASAKACGLDIGVWRYRRNLARIEAKTIGVTPLSLYIERNLLSTAERKKLGI